VPETRFRPIDYRVALATADTEYSFILPEGGQKAMLRLADATKTFRWSTRQGVVQATSGDNGVPAAAGEVVTFDGPLHKTTIYVAHSDAAAQQAVVALEKRNTP